MALVKCIECGNIVSNEATKCPHCGISFESFLKCPECGYFIMYGNNTCSNCGCPITYNNRNKKSIYKTTAGHTLYSNKNPIICTGLILIAFVLFAFAIVQITNDKYKFYKEHYKECEAGYIEAKQNADMYSYGSMFRNDYLWIAKEYEKLMKNDSKIINEKRFISITLTIVGIVLIVIGLYILKGRSKYGTNKMS